MSKTINRKKSSGFTLIELIVVVSVAAIMASIAVPNFSSMIESNRATAATNELVSALILARSEALKRSNNVSVCASNDQVSCGGNAFRNFGKGWIIFQDCNVNGKIDTSVDCDNDGVADDDEETIKAHLEIKDIQMLRNGAAAARHYFSYTFSGRGSGSTVGFKVRKEGASKVLREIKISRSGRVRVIPH